MSARGSRGPVPGPLSVILLIEDGINTLRSWRRRRSQRKQLRQVRGAAEEDVTVLGEDIAGLDLDVADSDLAEPIREDYAQALDSYESAKTLLSVAQRPADLRGVTRSLEQGRYAMTCVRARLAGEPVPTRRAPCFFNPRHGPSITDMEWTPEGGVSRDIPVCGDDAARLADRERPEIRYVLVDGKMKPYWEAGLEYSHWVYGYYGAFMPVPAMLAGTALGATYTADYTGGDVDAGGGANGGFDGGGGGFDGGMDDAGGADGGG